jgi:hypothetical protein
MVVSCGGMKSSMARARISGLTTGEGTPLAVRIDTARSLVGPERALGKLGGEQGNGFEVGVRIAFEGFAGGEQVSSVSATGTR